MKISRKIQMELRSGIIWTSVISVLFVLFYGSCDSPGVILITLPFFLLLYFLFFSVGKTEIITVIRTWIDNDFRKVLLLPSFLIFLYLVYLLLNRQNPVAGIISMVPYLILFPLLVFSLRRYMDTKITWIDFVSLVGYLLLTYFIRVDPGGNLPFSGNSLDSMFHVFLMIIAVYVFSIIRGLNDVGFYPEFKIKDLLTSIWVWFVFYLFVFIVGYLVDFVKVIGYDSTGLVILRTIGITLLGTFLHTAVFEELFFRGILQNMLAKRIGQSGTWKTFWVWGLVILLPFAFLVGYTLEGKMHWFPALMTIAVFGSAFYIENKKSFHSGVYTSLAITSTIFGLVHYHSGAIIYIGFACIAGWAYGYTYIRTGNVFYSALVHTLVNSSVVIFGLEFMM